MKIESVIIMNKAEVKQIIIAVICLLIFVIIVFVINYFANREKAYEYLIVDGTAIFEHQNNSWKQITEVDENLFKQKYTVDTGTQVYKNVDVSYVSNAWYYVDQNYKDIDNSNVRVAYSNLDNIKLASFQTEYADESDSAVIQNALDRTSVSSFLNNTRKITFDFDGDGTDETLYTTSNASLSYTGEPQISAMFMTSNNEVQTLETNESGPYMILDILDLDDDNNYELIVSKGNIDLKTFDSCYQIYTMKNGKWQLMTDCTEE